MHYNTGYHPDAASLMRDFVRVFRDADVVCAPSASCVSMIREHYPKMAAESGDRDLAAAVAEVVPRVYEFTELLVEGLGVTDVGASYPHRVTLHTSCHGLRGLHLTDQPVRLLRAVRDLELIDLPRADECCGFGGTFAIKNADVSSAMVASKIDCVLETGADVCTATENSCLMQIGGALRRRGIAVPCVHVAEILASESPERRTPGAERRTP
jgi:L-lactate dehydrogenase complex protein LldE